MQADIPALARRLQQQKQQAAERYLANRRPNLFSSNTAGQSTARWPNYGRRFSMTAASACWPSAATGAAKCIPIPIPI